MKKFIPINTDADGNCATLRASYYKFSFQNFLLRDDGFRATAVIEYEEESDRRRSSGKTVPDTQDSDKGGVMIDCYNQAVYDDVCVTITTRIDSCNHYYVTELR